LHKSINNLISIETELKSKCENNNKIKIIAVSKTFSKEDILPLINHGHINFGENKIQEAADKWYNIKRDFVDIKLHMIGKLQSNKVKFAIPLFDYIHSLDNQKLAEKISSEQKKLNKNLKIFIQINIGGENQKNGINPKDLQSFYEMCTKKLNLDIIGLMCIPPNDKRSSLYFSEMKNLKSIIGVNELSMGMSNDYLEAIDNDASYIRIGSKIFGSRF
jgi:PLP dependent protein|tara:strand:+ start:126 stop:779 length:654 start_codon:yes stop_codon:yes gene_type:complete